ncbi:hypothetical protein WJX81_007931 [Elliptochloris bilobata]|uniref:Ubiquitin-like domain-containing protein n=1 Tax=Elliptochloris bilobata TaxID=381761 RepID=A0AAW1QVY1_9CHLO
MKLTVSHGKANHELDVSPNTTLHALKQLLEALTGALARSQKLICKGRVLGGGDLTVIGAKLKDGAKLMLLTSGSGALTQGQAAAAQVQREKAAAARRRASEALAQRASQQAMASSGAPAMLQARAAVWAKTGVIALRGEQPPLSQLPPAAMTITSTRVADFGNNALEALPAALGSLAALQRLRLSQNRLTVAGMPTGALAPLQHLVVLALDHNRLDALPVEVCALPRLQRLDVSANALATLPAAVSQLTSLRALVAGQNRLTALPPELGACTLLQELDARQNRLSELPAALGRLTHLQELLLDDNRLAAVPAALLQGCAALATLSLHSNPITMEALRASEGFQDFDARRCQKHDKQMTMRVMAPQGGFDEGADAVDWQRW